MPLSSHPQIPHNVARIRTGLDENLTRMALTQSSFNSSSAPQSQPQPPSSQLQLPSPQTFDILPALHELLARIDHGSIAPTTDPVTGIPDQMQFDAEGDLGALYTELQPLEPKDLPTEVLQIKAKIRRAVKELEKLPDMERTVEEQNEEIEELEERIRRQKEMIRRLGELARGVQGGMG